MKNILLVLFILISKTLISQDLKDSLIIGKVVVSDAYMYDNNGDIIRYLDENEIVFPYKIVPNNFRSFDYLVFNKIDSGYVRVNDILITHGNVTLLDNIVDENSFRKIAKISSFSYYKKTLENQLENYKNIEKLYKRNDLVITKKEYAYAEYGGEFGLKLSFFNGYNKDIKYIDITVRSYNRVGDPISDDFGRNVARPKVIGPVESKSEGSVTFENLFWDDRDVISRLVVTYLKVTFMDGSVKEIKNISNHIGPEVYNSKN